jgi:cyanophycin synthetase
VVTNIGEGDHLGMNFIHSVDDLVTVKRVIVQNVSATGAAVLNAMDPLVVKMRESCPGDITFFSYDPTHPVIVAHRAQDKRVVFFDGTDIVAAKGVEEIHRIPVKRIPMTSNGLLPFQIDNAMASVGAVWALGLPWSAVSSGLATFDSSANSAPGRFNLFEHRGATVVADYGHNPDAMRALVDGIHAMKPKRSHVVISGAGDRRDDDIRALTKVLGNAFDHVILYQDQCQRGREDGEVLKLLQEGLVGTTKAKHVQEIRGEFLAIDTALAQLEPGDVCLILIDQVEEALAYLASKVKP